jgi:hypothetical protein
MSTFRTGGPSIFDSPEWESDQTAPPFSESDLHQTWHDRVVESDNDFIVAITASSRTPISGTGKTTLAIQLARHFDRSETGFDAEEKASLSSEKVAQTLIPELPERSGIIFDEAQGTLASDGVDSRRGMADAVVKMARAAAQFRKRQHSLVFVSQSTNWIDSRMMELLDRLIIIQERGRATVYDHYRHDLPSADSAKEFTPAVEDIYWDALPPSDEDYQTLDRLKEQANDGDSEEDTVDKSEQIAKAASSYFKNDETWRAIEKKDWAEFSREWYRTRVQDLAGEV